MPVSQGAEVKDTEQHRVGAAQLLSTLMGSGGCAALISDAALAEVLSELANHIECCATWLLDGVGQVVIHQTPWGGKMEEKSGGENESWDAHGIPPLPCIAALQEGQALHRLRVSSAPETLITSPLPIFSCSLLPCLLRTTSSPLLLRPQGGIEEEQAEEDDSRWAAAAAALSALEKSVFCQPPAASWRANGSLIRILTAIFSLSWLVPHDVSASHEPPQVLPRYLSSPSLLPFMPRLLTSPPFFHAKLQDSQPSSQCTRIPQTTAVSSLLCPLFHDARLAVLAESFNRQATLSLPLSGL